MRKNIAIYALKKGMDTKQTRAECAKAGRYVRKHS